jgi:hypothetical protein
LLHRDGDLPAIEDADGTKLWYKDDKLQLHPQLQLHLHRFRNGHDEDDF